MVSEELTPTESPKDEMMPASWSTKDIKEIRKLQDLQEVRFSDKENVNVRLRGNNSSLTGKF